MTTLFLITFIASWTIVDWLWSHPSIETSYDHSRHYGRVDLDFED
jgi:hypothetical protein